MGRNHLAGSRGDAANAVLAAAGYNFRLLFLWISILCAWFSATIGTDPELSEALQNG
jgi:IS5 family transposase